jgi:hypothetical protein
MATGSQQLVAEVLAERIDVRLRLYLLLGGVYRIRAGSGLGWAPGSWKDYGKAMDRLLACASYGPADLSELRRICRQ